MVMLDDWLFDLISMAQPITGQQLTTTGADATLPSCLDVFSRLAKSPSIWPSIS
jgi:hypothetical protein